MFDSERAAIETQIRAYCSEKNLPQPGELQWSPLPFIGQWGISTSFFQLAATEARLNPAEKRSPVPQRAQEISAEIAAQLILPSGFIRADAVKGYLNLYYATSEFTQRVIETVLSQGSDFGRGEPKEERVMVEYAQPTPTTPSTWDTSAMPSWAKSWPDRWSSPDIPPFAPLTLATSAWV